MPAPAPETEPPATMQVSAFGLTRGPSRWSYDTALNEGKSSYTPIEFRDVLLSMARSALDRERPEDIASGQ